MESEQQTDTRRRPIVLQAQGADAESARRSPTRYFAWAGTGMIALAAAAGLVAGGTAVWSAFDPGTPGQSPAPLWVPPPATVQRQAATITPSSSPTTPDDHGGRRDDSSGSPRSTGPGRSGQTTEPGDDKGGRRDDSSASPTSTGPGRSGQTTEPGDDKGGLRKSGSGKSGRGSGSSGSGKSSDDPPGHH
jgi:hypothetical protein